MRVLGLTTSTARGSVALVQGSELCGQVAYEGEMHHAERLFGALDELLEQTSVPRAALQAVACDVGPGSFTGVRAGLAAAKGIALALDLPIAPVLSLEAMAAAALAVRCDEPVTLLACLLDAKRGETFYAVYDQGLKAVLEPAHVRSEGVEAALGQLGTDPRLRFVGQQASALGLDPARILVDDSCDRPDASWVARRGWTELERAQAPSRPQIDAVYLRAPDATPPRR